MLTFINIILVLSCIVAVISIMLLIWQKPSRGKVFLIMGMATAMIQCLGYIMEINADSLGEAMYGVKTEYLGSVYVVYFAFFFVCEICDVKLPALLKQGFFATQTLIFIAVFTNEFHYLYYRNIEFVKGGLYNHISFTKGPIYWLFMLTIVAGLLGVSYIALFSYRRMGKKRQAQVKAIIFAFQIPVVYLVLYLFGLTGGYDLMPLAVIVSFTICVVNVLRYNIFGLQEDAKEVVVDTLVENMVVVDKNYYYITANQSAKKLFPSLAKKGRMEEFTEEESILRELFVEGGTQEIALGEHRYQVRVTELEDNWKINGYLLILRDITDSYNYITKLEELRFSAEQASRAKSAFLANMSHEIRTPMNAILGMNEIMIHNGLEGDNLKYARDIEGSGRALLSIINDILDFAKIESGKMKIIEEPYEMQKILQNIVSMFKVRMLELPIDFIVNVDENIPKKMLGDQIRIRQILNNILGNAVKFTKRGSITLDISWERNDNRALIVIKVADTGIGIRKEDLEKIFLSFQQVDTRKNHSVEGTGLGLAITRDILKMMGGDITIESTYGKGSIFRMYFEQDILDDSPMGSLDYETEDAERPSLDFHTKDAKVLLVDDNRVNLRVAEGLMEPYGVQVDTAESGKECLEKVKEIEYDIIYMDHMMPELDGVDTLKLLRESEGEWNRQVPVVALTANAVRGMEEFFQQAGFQGYLSKPVSRQELGESLRRFLPVEKITEETKGEQKFDSFRKGCKARFAKVVESLKGQEESKARKALEGMEKQAQQMGCIELSKKFKEISEKGYEPALVKEIEKLIENL